MTSRQLKGDEIVRMEKLNGHLDDIDMQMENPDFDPLKYANNIIDQETQVRSMNNQRDQLRTSVSTRLELFPTVKSLANLNIRIKEAERLLNEPYEPGGVFVKEKGLNDQRRIILMDLLKDLRKLEAMEASK